MIFEQLGLRKVINKAYLRQKVARSDMETFKAALTTLLDKIEDSSLERSAEHVVIEFLRDAYYKEEGHELNAKQSIDVAIFHGNNTRSDVGVLLEFKKPSEKYDMPSLDRHKYNVKALHELLLYYLRERIEEKNLNITHLIITNGYQYFIFDEKEFDKYFYRNNRLKKAYEDWKIRKKDTTHFYKEIAAPVIDVFDDPLSYTYVDLRKFGEIASDADSTNDRKLIALYKLFSPAHLLKKPFSNDSNSLDRKFYNELLHIIGLEEVKEKGKKVIQRLPPEKRLVGSLLENTINIIEVEDRLRRVQKLKSHGDSNEAQLFGVGLELCLTWINRILFLKLLEAQLLRYHKGDTSYRFLSKSRIKDYDALNKLFFQVLAARPEERHRNVKEAFAKVPYLNSSLFDINQLEDDTIRINSLEDELILPIHPQTVLKNSLGKRQSGELNTLEYLFLFLDAYDFSSEGAEDIQEENKSLINASVLGLIFEKINGYKDGSFFTPGFITMYMCRETIRRAVIQKFNDQYDLGITSFPDLQNYANRHYKTEEVLSFNKLINELKVCDPAVGSGHFLVSALNELISIKSDLGILADSSGKTLPVRVEIENDELIVTDRAEELFEYHPGQPENQRIQASLFHEKQTIIENCLFGVDINPNSVKICRLRLWIELLKSAYYTADSNHQELETLPNIDINIKQGNSLISRFDLDANLKPALKKSKFSIDAYRQAVNQYQHAKNKEQKREFLGLIDMIKNDFRSEIRSKDLVQLQKLEGTFYERFGGQRLFEAELSKSEQKALDKDKEKLLAKIEKKKAEIAELKNNAIFQDAFEWRFEFPEVLDMEGKFEGFDVIIGNPPYIRQEEFSELKPYLQSKFETYAGTADLLVYFIENGLNLLRPSGYFNYIISNKFMRANFGKALRNWLQQFRLIEILDFGDLPVFQEATTYPCVIQMKKAAPVEFFQAVNVPALRQENFSEYLNDLRFRSRQSALTTAGWTLTDAKSQALLEKLKTIGTPLGEYVNGKIYYGIKTGLNEAFVIDEATKDRLIEEDPKSAEVIKPFLAGRDIKRYMPPKTNKFLIIYQKGWTIAQFGEINEEIAFEELTNYYPAIAQHLLPYKHKARKRYDKGDYWWELRACDYYVEFEKPKILYQEIATYQAFTLDTEKIYCNNKIFLIPGGDLGLLGFLNSKLVWFYLSNTVSKLRGDAFAMQSPYILSIPIPHDKSMLSSISYIASRVMSQEEKNTKEAEMKIDELVYSLYNLSPEEIQIIENATA